jgi:hypothetical protein
MGKLKSFALAAVMAAAFMALAASTASATELTNGSGEMITAGTAITSSAEGTTTLHPPFGDIECKKSTVEGSTTNTGGAAETVNGKIKEEEPKPGEVIHGLSFTECNATVTILKSGSLEIHTRTGSADNNGTLTSSGTEVTVEFIGTHCIFKTSSTDIGTLTGSTNTGGNATLDIEATIPRTGGRSGAFCGSTAQWTGSYKVTSPAALNVDSREKLTCEKVEKFKGTYTTEKDCLYTEREEPGKENSIWVRKYA